MHSGLQSRAAEIADRIVAADLGLNRLRMAVGAAVPVGTTPAVEYGVASLAGAGAQGTLVSMLVGVAVGARTDVMLVVFVAVMFVAVFVHSRTWTPDPGPPTTGYASC